jgi:hypothetical protein
MTIQAAEERRPRAALIIVHTQADVSAIGEGR